MKHFVFIASNDLRSRPANDDVRLFTGQRIVADVLGDSKFENDRLVNIIIITSSLNFNGFQRFKIIEGWQRKFNEGGSIKEVPPASLSATHFTRSTDWLLCTIRTAMNGCKASSSFLISQSAVTAMTKSRRHMTGFILKLSSWKLNQTLKF